MKTKPITERIVQPTADEIRAARKAANLTQDEAAQVVSSAQLKAYRTWQSYEAGTASQSRRGIPLAAWELFLLMTDQHPTLRIVDRQIPTNEKSH